MTYEKLPQQTQQWLTSVEKIINEWDWKSQQMAEARGELVTCSRLADSLDAQCTLSADGLRQDEQLLGQFKVQVERSLAEAREAESDFDRRSELQAYGRRGNLPSPFFAQKLARMSDEIGILRDRIAQLDGAVSSASKPALSPDDLQRVLAHHKALFDAAASRLQGQHERIEAHRRTLRAALRRDPFTEAVNREAAVRDKYKPPDDLMPMPSQLSSSSNLT